MTGFQGLQIGLIGPTPPPAGGMANQTRQLGELLRAEQAQVLLVATNPAYRPAWVGGLRGVRAGFRLLSYLVSLWRAAGQCQVFHLMANSGWSWHLFALPAIAVARLRSVPVVVNYRGGGAAAFLQRSQWSVRCAMRQTAALIVPSGFLVAVFERFGMPSAVVPNIIDLSRFNRRAPRRDGSAHLVVARNLEPLYDNATAIRALALVRQQLPQATMSIAGTGPDGPALRQLAAELGLAGAVEFTGTLDRDAMAALYRRADASLNPSLADNMPNSVLEAMASGVPVVSTNVGGVPYMVRDGHTGLLVPPGDAPAMAEAVLRVLQEPGLWPRLVEAGLAEVQRCTWPQVGRQLAAVYRDAIAGRPAHRPSGT